MPMGSAEPEVVDAPYAYAETIGDGTHLVAGGEHLERARRAVVIEKAIRPRGVARDSPIDL